MIGKNNNIILLAFLVMLLSSCSSYVGTTVNMNNPNICSTYTLPSNCSQSDEDFSIEYEINELTEANTYLLKGEVSVLGKGNFDTYTKITLMVFLINNGVIVDTFVQSLGSGEIGQEITFDKKFTFDDFDAIATSYSYRVQG